MDDELLHLLTLTRQDQRTIEGKPANAARSEPQTKTLCQDAGRRWTGSTWHGETPLCSAARCPPSPSSLHLARDLLLPSRARFSARKQEKAAAAGGGRGQKRRRNSAGSRRAPTLPADPFRPGGGPARHALPGPARVFVPGGWGQARACRGGRGIPSVTPGSWTPLGGARPPHPCVHPKRALPAPERSARCPCNVGPDSRGPTDRETGSHAPVQRNRRNSPVDVAVEPGPLGSALLFRFIRI